MLEGDPGKVNGLERSETRSNDPEREGMMLCEATKRFSDDNKVRQISSGPHPTNDRAVGERMLFGSVVNIEVDASWNQDSSGIEGSNVAFNMGVTTDDKVCEREERFELAWIAEEHSVIEIKHQPWRRSSKKLF